MHRIAGICIIIVLAALGLTSCEVWNAVMGITAYPGMAGNLLAVDANKHLKEDVKYSQWWETDTFNKDGTYEIDYYTGGAAVAQIDGTRGTYTYDPSTLTLTTTTTQVYNSLQAPNAWSSLASTVSESHKAQVFLAEHMFGSVYSRNGSTWVNTETYGGGDTSQPAPNNAWTYTAVETYGLAAGTGGFSYSRLGTYQQGTTPAIASYTTKKAGDANLFPEGATFEKGQSVNVHVLLTTNTQQLYNWTTQSLDPVNQLSLQYEDHPFSCMGDYIIEFPTYASRSLSP